METEITARQIKIHCPDHQTTFYVDNAAKIFCETVVHALSNDFPNAEFWEYCCDCQIFSPSDLEVGGTAKTVCLHCERPTVSRFVCGSCKIVSNDSGEDTKGKVFAVSFDSKTIEPACPGCLETFADVKLSLHKCEEAQAVFLTSRPTCPFCKKDVVRRPPPKPKKSIINCPKCKSLNPADSAFCVTCGGQLRSNISDIKRGTSEAKTQLLDSICPNCGNKNEPDSVFCPECGQKLRAVNQSLPPVVPVAPPSVQLPIPVTTPFDPVKANTIANTGASGNAKGCFAVIGILLGAILLCAIIQGITDKKNTTTTNTTESFATPPANSYSPGNYSDSVNSDSGLPNYFERTYSGTINGRSFTMTLKRDGNNLTGKASTSQVDGVSGNIDDDGSFTLRGYENDGNVQTGIYKGRINSDGSITGSWSKMQSSKEYYFSLTED